MRYQEWEHGGTAWGDLFLIDFTLWGDKGGLKNPPAIHPHRLLMGPDSPYTVDEKTLEHSVILRSASEKNEVPDGIRSG
jgi:hypothetical protein